MKSMSLHLRRICGYLKIVSFLHHCNVSKWTFIQTMWTSADNVHQSSTSGHSHTTDQADTCWERRAGGPHVFKGRQRAPADKARVKCLCGVVTSALSIVFALGQHPPLDDSGSSFTDLRVVYHLIIIALSHYFLCCILWALSLKSSVEPLLYFVLSQPHYFCCTAKQLPTMWYTQKLLSNQWTKEKHFALVVIFCCAEIVQLLLCLY